MTVKREDCDAGKNEWIKEGRKRKWKKSKHSGDEETNNNFSSLNITHQDWIMNSAKRPDKRFTRDRWRDASLCRFMISSVWVTRRNHMRAFEGLRRSWVYKFSGVICEERKIRLTRIFRNHLLAYVTVANFLTLFHWTKCAWPSKERLAFRRTRRMSTCPSVRPSCR